MALALTAPASASAHNSHGWFWGTRVAERGAVNRYSDVYAASCTGLGQPWRGLYKHFDCTLDTTDDRQLELTVHVLGKTRFATTDWVDITPAPTLPTLPPDPGVIGPGNGYPVICNDGSISNSGGIQGACSWHGGVA